MADTPLTPPTPSPAVGRRRFLATAAGATAALLVADRIPGAWAVPRAANDDPFTLGVASGDPTPTGVVLWTRLAPRPLDPDGGMPARPVPVDWEVSTGPRMIDVVARGRVVDAWDGYAADRQRILRALWERQPANPVVLSGDIHSFFVNDLRLSNRDPGSPVIATEFVGTSISSSAGKFESFVKHLRANPHVRYFDNRRRGYTRCTVIRRRWYADLRVVDTVERPGAGVRTLASFVVEDGRPGAERT